jgi:hypothetical protein
MDPEFALLTVESELLGEAEFDIGDLSRFGEVVATAAATPGGYSDLAWKGGARLLDVARRHGQDPGHLFDVFGWRALANGIQTALQDKRLLEGLSYASVPFMPPKGSPYIFDHPQVVEAIRTGLATLSQPFIKPSDLGAADAAVQTQFGELLSRLSSFPVDNELILQWSASALRVLPTESRSHKVAAIKLLETLCSEGRIAVAYYAFRALAEQHEDLWEYPVALIILQTFVDRSRQDEAVGGEVLAQLCVDDDVLRRCNEQFDLLVLVGSLAINLIRRYGDERTEATAWHFVNEMYGSSALVAYALGNYLTEGSLPPLPISRTDRLETLEQEFKEVVALAENELRLRRYALPLAAKIYQSNVREVFTPFLDGIRSGHCSSTLVKRIQESDPEELVTESELQKSATYPIDGKMLRKMVGDSSRILQALGSAALKRIELDKARAEWAAQPDDELELFQEFSLLLEELDEAARWALETLLPDLWTRLEEGVTIAIREQEARRYGAR